MRRTRRWRGAPTLPTRSWCIVRKIFVQAKRGARRFRGLTTMTWLARHCALTQCVFFIGIMLLIAGAIDAATAAPFGVGGSGPPEVGGFTGWVLHEQAGFYRMLSGAIRASKADGSAAWTLLGISFAYGVFHAAGPGHGKAVISSYLVANDETWKRGIALSFAAAILQSLTAIVIVAIAAVLLNAHSKAMEDNLHVVEMVGYGLIILIGLRLLWVKGRAFWHLLRPSAHAHDHAHHDHHHDHDHHRHDHRDHDDEAHDWGHPHAPANIGCGAGWPPLSPSVCGHARAPSLFWCLRWRKGCSGSALPPPSSWGSAPRSPSRRLPRSRSARAAWRA